MKKLIAAVTTAGLLVTGTAGIAYAADTPGASAPTTEATGDGRRAGAALDLAASTIGIDRSALVKALRDGKSVADIAQANDVDPKTVTDALVAAAAKKVDTAVTNGRIDADRAATIKERLPDRVAKLVNGDLRGRAHGRVARANVRRHARRAGFALAADTIGITPKELLEAVRGGQSIADVARARNVDPKAVIDAVVAAANTKIDAAVSKGRIDAERATKLKERVAERVAQRVNQTPPEPSADS